MGNAQWLTTIRVISILLLSFVVFFIYSNYQTGKFLSNSGLPSPDPLLSQMRNDLNELEKFSPEYLELYQKINSYERIYKEKLSEATNPDQFYDGLAAIKTNHL
ncbi:MAG: hypothetical protein KDD94_13900, partial [Calditrichaeota bacterium]|nr:hypothetical protein [Calditrichota bacterium]